MLNKEQISTAIKSERKRKMFVGNLSGSITNKKLKNYFSKFGEITNAYTIKKPGSCESRGFGYVTFATEAAMKAVLQSRHKLDGREVVVESFLSKEEQKKSKVALGTKVSEVEPKYTGSQNFFPFKSQTSTPQSNDHFVIGKKGGRQFGMLNKPPVASQTPLTPMMNKFAKF